MFKNTINWGSVILGATLVTGIAAAIAFVPSLLEAGKAGDGITGLITQGIKWVGENWGKSLASGAAIGAVTGLFASNATNQEDITIDR